jgi:hypothetical protein
MSKYRSNLRTNSSVSLIDSLKFKYPQKDYDQVPKKSSIVYYLSVLVKDKPDVHEQPKYIDVNTLNPNDPMFVENSYIRRNIDAIIDLGYRPYSTFNILLRICYKPKYNNCNPYFQLSVLVYIFHTVIKKNTTQLTELFIANFNSIKDYLIESCYGNTNRNIIVYRPLEISAFYGNVEAFKHLIANGAKYDKLNSLNETVRDIINAGILHLDESTDEISKHFRRDSYVSCLDFLELTEHSPINEQHLSFNQS